MCSSALSKDGDTEMKKMEDPQSPSIDICRGQKLVVTVLDAQPDLLLVSYEHGTQVFQGVLLDSTKGRLPCGIYPPGGEFPPEPPKDTTPISDNDDKLYSVKQRHTYFQQDTTPIDSNSKAKKGVQLRQSISLTQRFKNSRMTVRLRPRQVLCSKCQSICNEKSENVSGAKGQRATEPPTAAKPSNESRGNTRSSRDKNSQEHHGTSSSSQNKRAEKTPQKNVQLVPKLVKLKPSEIEAATNKGVSCLRKNSQARGARSDSDSCDSEVSVGSNTAYSVSGSNSASDGRVPKLKLSANLCAVDPTEVRRKGRIPKMTISTLNLALQSNEASKENWEGEGCELKSHIIPKMILSTSGIVSEAVDKKDKEGGKGRKLSDSVESQTDAKELRLRSGNVHKLTVATAGHQDFGESSADRVSPIPKLTILPLIQKKDSQEEKDTNDVKHHKLGKACLEETIPEKMSLRKKRSLGSMEDLWDESVFDETAKKHKREDIEEENEGSDSQKLSGEDKDGLDGDKPKATPVLKISFGPEGKGTVLKIPSKSTVVTISTPEGDTEEEMTRKYKDMSAKAAKKALKKAKKEAQKKTMLGGASPAYIMGGMSPRFGGMSPLRLGGMSPARLGGFSPVRFGGTSPARFGGMSPARAAAVDLSTRDLPPKKHKHKVKHKKKHKDERRHKSPDETKAQVELDDHKDDSMHLPDPTDPDIPVENITPELQWNSSEGAEYNTDQSSQSALSLSTLNSQSTSNQGIPLQPSRHKLSISIKRVSNASYVACDSSHSDGERTVTPTNPSRTVTPTNPSSNEDVEGSPQEITFEMDDIKQEKSLMVTFETEEYGKDASSKLFQSYELEGARTENSTPVIDTVDDRNDQPPASTYGMETPEPSLSGSDSPGSDDTCSGAIPDFPSSVPNLEGSDGHPSAALLMKFSWQEVEQCEIEEGRVMTVGDVVWGKIHGFPWWPAKVMAIRVLREGSGDTKWQQAHVSWYGSSTSSLMPANTLQPFLQMFKTRYNKRKRGPYREAIKQATCEAEQILSHDFDFQDREEEQQQQQHQTPENLLGASPREVDVVS